MLSWEIAADKHCPPAEGVSTSKRTYKHPTPPGCSLTDTRCFSTPKGLRHDPQVTVLS
jgi:hypothetical protein